MICEEDTRQVNDKLVQSLIVAGEYQKALEPLVITYQDSILQFCTGMLGDRCDGRDVAQEVFLAAYTAFPRFQQQSSVRTWLFAIARHQCYKALRNQTRQRLQPREEIHIARIMHPDPAPIPGEVSHNDLLDYALECLSTLPDEERAIVLMRCKHGLSHSEVAEVLQVSKSTVERRWKGALQSLEEHINAMG